MTRIAPSKVWLSFVSFLWGRISTRGRFIVIASLVLPAANRISSLGAFAITIRFTSKAMHSPLTPNEKWIYGGAILGAFLMSELIGVAAAKAELSLQRVAISLARGLRMDELLATRNEKKARRAKAALEEPSNEKDFVSRSALLVQNIVRFSATLFLVVALLLVIGWIYPLVSVLLALGGAGLLLFLRSRIRSGASEETGRAKARKQLMRLEETLVKAEQVTDVQVSKYLDNRFDQMVFEAARAKQTRKVKIIALAGAGIALATAAVFFFIAW